MSRRPDTPARSDSELATWLKQSLEKLSQLKPEEVAKKCGVVFLNPHEKKDGGRFIVNLLNKTFTVELASREVVDLITGKQVHDKLAYVIAEYLATGDGTSLSDSWVPMSKTITAQELSTYFQKTVIRPMTRLFGHDSELFEASARALGGKRELLGGRSFSFLFLPKVKLLFQVWAVDKRDLTPPAVNVSHSSNATRYLKPLPLTYACEIMVDWLEKEAKKQSKGRASS
ncbi:MAG: DUF3786 domain-containing protein [Aigarchaeota archaeon]|nr:DUF3786 domain-containing protein [Candidatus Pelearchaeum maunauluense]